MNAGQLAALIAAVFFALLACVAVVVLVRLAKLMSAATGLVTDYRARTDHLLEQAQAAVDRTNEQLARTDAITANMDQVTANMAELSGHVSALAGLARGLSSAAAAPMHGIAAFAFGMRRATAVRRSLQVAAVARDVPLPRRAALIAQAPAADPITDLPARTASAGAPGPAAGPARPRRAASRR